MKAYREKRRGVLMTDTEAPPTSNEPREDGDFKVVRANALKGGEVVYLVSGGAAPRWSHDIAEATVYRDADIEEALAIAEKDAARNVIVGPEAIEITGKHEPVGAKETIRASGGPTIKYGEDALQPDYSI
jgi:Protein of unknown function (DUF2849)